MAEFLEKPSIHYQHNNNSKLDSIYIYITIVMPTFVFLLLVLQLAHSSNHKLKQCKKTTMHINWFFESSQEYNNSNIFVCIFWIFKYLLCIMYPICGDTSNDIRDVTFTLPYKVLNWIPWQYPMRHPWLLPEVSLMPNKVIVKRQLKSIILIKIKYYIKSWF